MFGWDDARDNYNQAQDDPSVGQEVLAGAASFGAMHEYEKHCAANGRPENHGLAKELLAGFAGAEVDKYAQRGYEGYEDRQQAKQQAQDQANQLYDQHYGDGGNNGPHQYLQDQYGQDQYGQQGNY